MNSGYILKELKLTGDNIKSASIIFTKGLNIITGPSDCGKSYIFQCINYMLGASTPPKSIKESKPYNTIELELFDYKSNTYTLKSGLRGGDFKLYRKKINDISEHDNYETLKRKHDPNNDNNISAFLLKLNNLYQKKIRTNAQGKTRSLSYRDVIKFLMINEENIIKEDSLIQSHYTKKTEESNVFKLIITGSDDSNVIQALNKNQIHNRKGKIELLNVFIKDKSDELSDEQYRQTTLFLDDEIKELDIKYNRLNDLSTQLNNQFQQLENLRNNELANLKKKQNKENNLKELSIRSSILSEQYKTDILRLRSTIEASTLLINDEHTFQKNCPLCNSQTESNCSEDELIKIINSCGKEINKIQGLLTESQISEKLILEEITKINIGIQTAEDSINSLSEELELGVGKQIGDILDQLKSIVLKKNEYQNTIILKDQLDYYLEQRHIISETLPVKSSKNKFENLTTSSLSLFSDCYYNVLKEINFPNLTGVSFSDEKVDFVISGEDRGLSGKGVRAITYASFIMTIQEYIHNKKYSIGVPIIDSPLVTYRKPENKNDGISVDLAMDFYRYLSQEDKIPQSIIIENEEPPEDLMKNLNFIKFGNDSSCIREGFIPI